jgi:hypothetical protein
MYDIRYMILNTLSKIKAGNKILPHLVGLPVNNIDVDSSEPPIIAIELALSPNRN